MAWFPGAVRKVIDPGPNDPPIRIVGAVLHVDAGNSRSLFSYFKDKSGGIESHLFIPKAARVEQYRDSAYEADAQYHGNSWTDPATGDLVGYLSIETQGLAAGEWNAYQLDQIKKVLTWASTTHKFPLTVCKTPTDPGVGYHVMWGAPSEWTPHAKVCPGPDRVRQFENILVPWFNQAPAGTGGTPGKVDDLANADEVMAELKKFEAAEAGRYSDLANRVQTILNQEAARYGNYTGRFDKIDETLSKLQKPPA